jgi:hypothetical protein
MGCLDMPAGIVYVTIKQEEKMAYYKNQEEMFLKRAEQNKKEGDRYWAMALEAEANGKPADEVEKLKKQAWYQYNSEKENRKKAEENKGKTWK